MSDDPPVDAGGRISDQDPFHRYVGRDTFTLVEPRPFGRYTLIAGLGRGGTGDVFLALSSGPSGFQKLVVLKVLHEHFEEDPDAVRMFLEEAKIAVRLHHPNVIQTFEVNEAEGRHYVAMKYAAGMGIDQILTACRLRGRLLPIAFCARVAAEILAGLSYAHGKVDFDGTPLHIVHRDVSPANVIIGWDGTVKVVDFGIAKTKLHHHDSNAGIVRGRFAYMAPEQAQGNPVDHRADVWSVGVVLWEMLAGTRLFRQPNSATPKALAEAPIPAAGELRSEVPQLLSDIVAMALQRHPAERYPSAASMRHDLEAWLAEEGGGMNRDDIAATLGDYFEGERERQHLLLGESVGGLPLTSTGTGSFAVPPHPALDETSPSSEEMPVLLPRARMPLPLIGLALLAIFAALALFLTRPRKVSPTVPPSTLEAQ